jgi:hypothetical protein
MTALRVFDPTTEPPAGAAWTLRDAWTARERADSWDIICLAASTLRKYRLAVRRFEEWAAKESLTQPLLADPEKGEL